MELHEIDIKPSAPATPEDRRLPLIAGPMVWYALSGASILLALYVFLFGEASSELKRDAAAIFIGLWAPMFGILGLRAEIMEMREDLAPRRRRGRG